MTQEGPTPSLIIPVLVAVLACDVAVADPASGKKNLIGIFDRILVSQLPTQRPISLYLKLTDVEGHYNVDVKFVQVSTGRTLAGARGQLQANNRQLSTDVYMSFPNLPIPTEGRYEFQVWVNSILLGGTFIDVNRRLEIPRKD